MSEFKKDNNIFSGKGEKDGKWITANGNKIFIKDGEDVGEAVKEHFDKVKKSDNIKTEYDNFGAEYEDKEYATKWTESLTTDQSSALYDYTDSGFVYINEALRTGKNLIAESHKIEKIQAAINNYDLKRPIKVFRVTNEDFMEGRTLESLIGKTLTDEGFMSCTTDERYALHILGESVNEDIIFEIGVPSGKGRGAYIGYVSKYGTTESEFLLNKGLKLKVTEVERKGSHIKIKGEIV